MSPAGKQMTWLRGAALISGAALLLGAAACGGQGGGLFGRGSFPGGEKEPVTGLRAQADALHAQADALQHERQRLGLEGMDDEAIAEAARRGIPEHAGAEEGPGGDPVPDLPNVYFEFDSDELGPSAQRQLEQNAAYLQSNPDLQVVLRGHTDERGTAEYNVALGSRRAQAVRDDLVERGIAADRMRTISFGREMPVAEGDDEASHAQNRRVEFFVFTVEEE